MTLFFYLLRQLTLATVFASVSLAFVVFPGVAVSAVHKLGGVSLTAVLQYIPMIGAELAPYLLSLGFLLGTVSTFGRLGADREWIAIQMSGQHPWRSLIPGLLLAGVLGGGTYWLASDFSPLWKYESANFRTNALLESFRNGAPGRTEIDFGKFYLGSEARDRETGEFVDVQVRVPSEEGIDRSMVAKRAKYDVKGDYLLLEFKDMRSIDEAGRAHNENPIITVPLDLLVERRDRDRSRAAYRSSREMAEGLRSGEVEERLVDGYRFEIHRRYALGIMFGIFLVVGASTGLWLRNGQLTGLGIAALYAFVYYVLSMRLGRELAENGVFSPVLAAWTTNLIGGGLAAACLWRFRR